MLNEHMLFLGRNRSEIRELFEYGKTLTAQGKQVCDLTLGNPSTPTPKWVSQVLSSALENPSVHAYTSAQGSLRARRVIAKQLNERGNTRFSPDGVVITCGAAAALCGVIKTLVSSENTEIIALSPYFPEYKVFTEGAGAQFITVGFCGENFTPDIIALKSAVTKNTHAVIINSPNNPSGKVFTAEEITAISQVLSAKEKEYGHPIYLISDEPYREILFSENKLPFIPDFYKNTIICYSYSKSLSLPGERIGYIAIPDQICAFNDLYAGFLGSLRSYGYVCAPSIFQFMIENFKEVYADFSVYESNKNLLANGLIQLGFTVNDPQGAFYLMVKAPDGDSKGMSEKAKELGLLIVPADTFGAKGYLRLATCVSHGVARDSLLLFEKLAKIYGLI